MEAKTLRVLDFYKVLGRLEQFAATNWGRELCRALTPSNQAEAVAVRLEETAEASKLFEAGTPPPLGGIFDLRVVIKRAALGSTLEPSELNEVAETCSGTARLRKFMADRLEQCPRMAGLAEGIRGHRLLEEKIRAAITENSEVADGASPLLGRIRRGIRSLHERIRVRLDGLIRSPETQKYLQDAIVTIRGDRFVVPVKQEHRGQMPGIIHDTSASGATLFVEPLAVVQLNNQLRELAAEERQEVERILRELTGLVASHAETLLESCRVSAELDCVISRGRLSQQMLGVRPELNGSGIVDIRQGRHPLLGDEAVAIDVNLGVNFDTLVLTGPNTGGKTVALKTVGLFALMAQSGLHVPALPGTRMTVFSEIRADIGDEQSIEQSLSTFSAHMTNIIRILREVGPNSLVLLDELGAGTDPAEGAALAMAILDELHGRGCRTMATTHYSELKMFAFSRSRVENASVEFDAETLRPTYRLLIGMPGRSNAFLIAARLGLDKTVIGRAEGYLGGAGARVEDVISQVEETRIRMEREQQAAQVLRDRADRLKSEYDEKLARLEERERSILQRASEAADQVLASARREAEEVVRRQREARREADQEQAIQEARRRIEESRSRLRFTRPVRPAPGSAPTSLSPGETVEIITLGQTGRVLSEPSNGQVMVQAGILKIQVKLADLRRVPEKRVTVAAVNPLAKAAAALRPEERSGRASSLMMGKVKETSPEVDLRGLTVEEAVDRTDKFLDDALLAGIGQVRIIHGKGTGTLRRAVREFLDFRPGVLSHRLGKADEGGDGVTIAALEV